MEALQNPAAWYARTARRGVPPRCRSRRPRDMSLSTSGKLCLVALAIPFVVGAAVFATLFALVCKHCNRLGNFLDVWYQRSLVESLLHGLAVDNPKCNFASTVSQHTQCEQGFWRHAVESFDATLFGTGWGVHLYRQLRMDHSPSLTAFAYFQRAKRVPPPAFWHTSVGRELMSFLRNGDTRKHIWVKPRWARALMPYLRPSLQHLVRSFKASVSPRSRARNFDTCVIHYRAGDFQVEETAADAERSAASVVTAARTMPRRCSHFELLDGGVTTHVCSDNRDCGLSLMTAMEAALRLAFPNASLVRISRTPEEDFLRMVDAPMLIVGGGSYATYGALASSGIVRVPRCVLRFGESDCVPTGTWLASRLRTYDSPMCKCIDSANSTAPRVVQRTGRSNASKGHRVRRRGTWRPTSSETSPLAKYRLPGRDRDGLLRALQLAKGIYAMAQPSHATSTAVLLTSFNSAYLDLYVNWVCYARTLGLRHLVWLQDHSTAERLRKHFGNVTRIGAFGNMSSTTAAWDEVAPVQARLDAPLNAFAVLFYSEHLTRALGLVPWGTSFQTRAFNRLSVFKLMTVKLVLHAGYDAWFCDVDVVLLRDPWPLFARASVERSGTPSGAIDAPTCDYEYSANAGCVDTKKVQRNDAAAEGNTGFHLFVRSERTLRLLHDTLNLAQRSPHLDDQTLLWQVIQQKALESKARFTRVSEGKSSAWPPPPPPLPLSAPPSPPLSPPYPLPPQPPHVVVAGMRFALRNFFLGLLEKSDYGWEDRHLTWVRPPPPPSRTRPPLTYCVLPRRTHVSGMCFDSKDAPALRDAAVLHANWMSGHARKQAKLQRAGLWRASNADCATRGASAGSWALGLASWVLEIVTHRTGRAPELVVDAVG
jgi:hypothetical protein